MALPLLPCNVTRAPSLAAPGEPGAPARLRAEEGGPVVGQPAAQAHGRLAAQVPLGLPPGGDAVDGCRLCPGEEVEGGRCQEGTGVTAS